MANETGGTMHRIVAFALMASLLPLSVACSGSNNSTNISSVDWAKGRGDAACHEWQQAYCELVSKCGGVALADCGQQYQGIACNSDTTAANCATSLTAASCSAMPAGCGPTDLADTAPAMAGCNQLYTAICTHNSNCGSATATDSCVSQLQAQNNCSGAIGLELSFETCLAKIAAASCTTSTQPAECTKVLVNAQ